MEQNKQNAPHATLSNGLFDQTVRITVRSIRKRRVDTEGVSFKAALDALVKDEVLKDDTAQYVQKVTFEATELSHEEEEKTIITIEEIE